MPGSTGPPPGGDRPAGVHGATPSRDPLPSEEEADALFREVPVSRSREASPPARWSGVARTRPGRRRRARPQVVAALVVVVTLGALWTAALRLPSDSVVAAPGTGVAAGSGLPGGLFDGDVCLLAMPASTDGPFRPVACRDERARARVLGVAVLSTQDDRYPGPQEVDRLARGLCHQDFGLGGPYRAGAPAVAVPDEVAWSTRGDRYVVCAESLA
ncbi:hypothetical protein [Kineosporia sp. R_H_3]|uniref:hypothetical protein n=1 Tax=Kineosporia sp. R_H_3 TaxID=1961848 RepID=UPI001179951B|nr:hypothetical protein [Kineosporia sp. R_H_3]